MLRAGDIGRAGDKLPAKPAPRKSRVVAYKTAICATVSLTGSNLEWTDGGKRMTEPEWMAIATLSASERKDAICPIDIHGKHLCVGVILNLMEFLHPGSIILPAAQEIRTPDGALWTAAGAYQQMKHCGVFGDSAP